MKRLRSEAGLDPISERGLELLRRTPGTQSSPARKRRVWASLQRTTKRGRRAIGIGGLGAGIAGLALATTAAAALGGHWISSARGHGGAPAMSPAGAREPHPRGVVRKIAGGQASAQIATGTETVVQTPRPAPARKLERKPEWSIAAPPSVLDALVALRRDHDAAKAARLLDAYLAATRHGALREEALALAIEAADAERDLARARLFAGAYADEYPAGRFAPFARRHLGEGPGESRSQALRPLP